MKIAILGTGNIGGNLGKLLAQAGHRIIFASRNADSHTGLLSEAPGSKITALDAAIDEVNIVIDALPFSRAMDLDSVAMAGKILITASNYYPRRDGTINAKPSHSEALAARLPETRRPLTCFTLKNLKTD